MQYKGAIIGCHGVGKTTLVNKLAKHGFNIIEERSINEFMGENNFLSEIKIIIENILLNKDIKNLNGPIISDRFAFLDVLIYSEVFHKLGWITEEQLKIIYSIINNSNYEWNYPDKIIVMQDSKEVITNNILKRSREKKLKESDEKYIEETIKMYERFYNGELEFKYLRPDIREKLKNIPKYKISCYEDLNKVLNILNS